MQADLRAGFTAARDMSTHGNGYGDIAIRDAINQGRIDGPRYQVSTLGIVWGAKPADPANPDNPLASTVVRSVEDARAAVREQIAHGADWIKLYPDGAYSFTPTGKAQYVADLSDAGVAGAHRGNASPGQEEWPATSTAARENGTRSSPAATPSSTAFGLDQEQVNMMVAKGLYYDPTLQRYIEPYMDDNDAKSTGGKYPHHSDFRKSGVDGGRDQRNQDHGGQRRRWRDVSRMERRRSISRRW